MKKNNVFEDNKPFHALIVAIIAIIAGMYIVMSNTKENLMTLSRTRVQYNF